ncbi:DNA-binding XRE family transcriptional regulator [Prosthecobacter fusiformis]|uniref:DNA-binding XRE family transcriptional regulator n=1 Tax=Prosthecobacter fusiformis TaxID=48464 RepID=A0A4R7RNA1_9BACT|nr:helix-turn-helix transcriptional regulator [Prosthecobacter fusiformis]TDU66066.1 DNA-binding XRE family transcriptional regulator [Prosthecobacter fusiformis]
MTIGNTLRLLREYHGMKQIEVASRLKLPRSLVSEIEGGKKVPGLEILKKYADGFDLPVSNLLLLAEMEGCVDPSFFKNPPKYIASKIFKILEWLNDRALPDYDSIKD